MRAYFPRFEVLGTSEGLLGVFAGQFGVLLEAVAACLAFAPCPAVAFETASSGLPAAEKRRSLSWLL